MRCARSWRNAGTPPVRDGHAKLVSISLAVDALDPLAVLESIYEPGEPHFYAERPAHRNGARRSGSGAGVRGARPGAVRGAAGVDATTPWRIPSRWVTSNAPFGGPHFFAAFAFHDEVEARRAVPGGAGLCAALAGGEVGHHHDCGGELCGRARGRTRCAGGLRVWRALRASFAGRRNWRGPQTSPGPSVPHFATTEVGRLSRRRWRGRWRDRRGPSDGRWCSRGRRICGGPAAAPAARPERAAPAVSGLLCVLVRELGAGRVSSAPVPERLVRVSRARSKRKRSPVRSGAASGASEDAALGRGAARAAKKICASSATCWTTSWRGSRPSGIAVDATGETATAAPGERAASAYAVARGRCPPACICSMCWRRCIRRRQSGGSPRAAARGGDSRAGGISARALRGGARLAERPGRGEFFVGIRSALVDGATRAGVRRARASSPGSTPEKEFAETELKFKAMVDAIVA
jgi:menaquinone-specific isochorismate synthase